MTHWPEREQVSEAFDRPYAMALSRQIEQIAKEQELVALRGVRRVDVDGPTAQEILLRLRVDGPALSGQTLAHAVGVKPWLLAVYAKALRTAGLVTTWPRRHGGITVRIKDGVNPSCPAPPAVPRY